MSMPIPSNIPTPAKSGELTDDEYGYILDATLKEHHRRDTSIIKFIESFVRCKSIAQASDECGLHKSVGYKYRHWKDVALAIQKIEDKSSVKYGMDSTEIFQRVKEVVDFDPIEMMNQDGTYKSNMHDISPEARRCLKKLKVKNLYQETTDLNGMKSKIIVGELIEYEFYDKLKASELVGKEKEMFKNTTKVEHSVTKDMASLLLASTKRADKAIESQNKPIDVEGRVIK